MATFRTRARAVDMLGRQQIAGIPTAISELFKNAHDAYADHAIVDFFRSDRLFVLRDDGIGMTEDDFEQRWLTLGTESKLADGAGLGLPPKRLNYKERPLLGEKGIGRLAIAAIGPQALMLSRPLRGNHLGDLLVSFIHWGLFELPSASLSDIEIPTVMLPGGVLPRAADVGTLIDLVAENLASVARHADSQLVKRIHDDLDSFRAIAPASLEETLGEPSLADGPGTHFYILPASELLADELDSDSREQATPLRRVLVGFANTMTPGHAQPAMTTAFRDHYAEDAYEDVINEAVFFTPEEFAAADHHIQGRFDEYGQFTGTVSVYGADQVDYVASWRQAKGSRTRCGPFSFNLAYVQGLQRDTKLEPELFNEISAKLSRFGGLYIYRDGIRVLPYGNTDFDFLDIEVRRAKSASDAFFSYRRMFGVIELTKKQNSNLREKAGREGFSDNEAYRQFREILKAFLYQVAFDFFREHGTRAERFLSEKSELNRLDKARRRRTQQTSVKRKAFSADLDKFFSRVDADEPTQDVADIIGRLEGRISSAHSRSDPTAVSAVIESAEAGARSELRAASGSYEIARPRGVGLTKAQTRSWLTYENERARLDEQIFRPANANIDNIISRAFNHAGVAIHRRLRFDDAINRSLVHAKDAIRAVRRELDSTARGAVTRTHDLGRDREAVVDAYVQDVLARVARLEIDGLSDEDFAMTRSSYEDAVASMERTHVTALESVISQLTSLVWPEGAGDDQVTFYDEVEALETDLDALREQTEQDLELAQLGAAIEVINHEFEGTINNMRRNLRRIKAWADANPALRGPYRDLRSSFEHLDGYLRLFTPLHRRLYRTAVEISGAEIDKYLHDVFDRKLADASVDLLATKSFLDMRVMQYPSVLYPVFVNLVDNAIYWLSEYRGERSITLDIRGGAMIVRDSGPGVSMRDEGSIFEFAFTRKPGGRGYGLYISREVLRREGWLLELSTPKPNSGAEFVIRKAEVEK
jgi:signal transduction histidine kinase